MKSRRQRQSGSASASAGDGEGNSSHGRMERKDVEKNRRLHMKALCLKLSSLIPTKQLNHAHLHGSSTSSSASNNNNTSSKDGGITFTQLDHLDNAAAYIRQLKDKIHHLRQRGAGAAGGVTVPMPVVEVRCMQDEATLDVVLISRAEEPFKLHQVIAVLEQEGAEVLNATFSAVGDKIFYTIHSQSASAALHASRVSQRLRDLLLLP